MGSKPSAERDPGAMGFYLSPIPSAVGPVMKGRFDLESARARSLLAGAMSKRFEFPVAHSPRACRSGDRRKDGYVLPL